MTTEIRDQSPWELGIGHLEKVPGIRAESREQNILGSMESN
jgi:hypothetical protein